MKPIPKETIEKIKSGAVAILPTDTIYGIVGSALRPDVVERVYELQMRPSKKPVIVLISGVEDLKKFKIILSPKYMAFLKKIWPAPISVIIPCPEDEYKYLHRGTKAVAFRIPKDEWLRNFLKKTGPLVAPSANPEGLKPAMTVQDAKNYFGERVDVYIDGGIKKGEPSMLIEIKR